MKVFPKPAVCQVVFVYLLACACLSAQNPPHPHGMVVAQEPLAADVGLRVLQNGGNAVDAAIAVGFVLAVTHPSAGNIGGGGFLLVRMADGHTAFLDFRESAPAAAKPDMYLGRDGKPTRDSLYGWRSSGVPGTVAGFAAAHKKFGTKPWASLVAPAIDLARDGFPVTPRLTESLQHTPSLATDPESKRIFLNAAATLRQPDLANTLERIARDGAKGFYAGPTAQRIAAEMRTHGGLVTEADLHNYRVIERAPLTGTYGDYEIITAPPPSAGGIGILQMLGILQGTHYATDGPDSPKAVHYEAEAMRRFYADRSAYLGDPDFYNVPVRALLDPKYLAWRRRTIPPDRADSSADVQPGLPHSLNAGVRWSESNNTTHYNVVDAQGNAAAVTYTLNNSYGNGITVPGLGFLLNDEMDDFVAAPGVPNMFGMVGSDANSIQPGKRPLSSMDPVIATRNNKLFLVAGAPGGSRITTGVLEVLLDIFDFHLDAQQAVDLPRFHEQWQPDFLYLEPNFPKRTADALAKMGYTLRTIDGVARVQVILDHNGTLEGATDPREGGKVAAY